MLNLEKRPELASKTFNPEDVALIETQAYQAAFTGNTQDEIGFKVVLLAKFYGLSLPDAKIAQVCLYTALERDNPEDQIIPLHQYFRTIKARAPGLDFDVEAAMDAKLEEIFVTRGDIDPEIAIPVLADYYGIIFSLEPEKLMTVATAEVEALMELTQLSNLMLNNGNTEGYKSNWELIKQNLVRFYDDLHQAMLAKHGPF